MYWRFNWARALDPDSLELLRSIPGFRFPKGDQITSLAAPENAAWLAAELLGVLGVEYRVIPPRKHKGRSAKAALPYLREWVPGFLTPYQREGVLRVLAIPGESGHYWWSAGSGKTLGALIWDLAAGPRLSVVVTKAAIRPTWTREIETYTQGVEWKVLEGRKADQEIEGLPAAFSISPSGPGLYARPVILVTGYDTLPDWISIIEKLKPTSVIFDEIHKVKNWKRWNAEVDLGGGEDAQRNDEENQNLPEPKVSFALKDNQAAACYRLSRIAKRRLGTTATPIKDRVRDLWAQLDLIHPWEWGGFYPWARRYAGASENVFGGIDTRGKSNLEELKKRLTFVAHRVPYSVANRDLPPKRRLVTYIKVADQCRPEGGIKGELLAAGKHGPHALLEARLMEAASRKRKIVLAHCHDALEAGLKVVVFTGRRVDCDRLRDDAWKWIDSKGRDADGAFAGPIPSLSLFSGHGGDSPDRREEIRKAYMAAPGPALLIGTGDAWGEGLDLQDTDLGIFAMLPYTPGQIIQWEGRWTRRGQKRPVLIRYLICEGSIDEHVATILLGKLPSVEKATDSDEIAGLGRELIGASEEELLNSLCSKVLGEAVNG